MSTLSRLAGEMKPPDLFTLNFDIFCWYFVYSVFDNQASNEGKASQDYNLQVPLALHTGKPSIRFIQLMQYIFLDK